MRMVYYGVSGTGIIGKKEIRVLPQDQAPFHVGYAEDLRRGFEERSAYWRTIEVVGVQLAYILWRKQYNHQSS